MLYLQGTIGYSIFLNTDTRKKIVIFADMHDQLPPCPFSNSIKIAEWLNKKIKTCKLLLEEVDRTQNYTLESLWTNSTHTIELRNLFIYNQNTIEPIDIRPFLIPFNWEIIETSELKNILLSKYLEDISDFFKLKTSFFKNKLSIIKFFDIKNIKIKIHFKILFYKFNLFLTKHKNILNITLFNVYTKYKYILNELDIILNDCMEWYTCALINKYKHHTIIIHAGLFHTEKINKLLSHFYKFKIIFQVGMNKITDVENHICQPFNNKSI